CLGPLLCLFAPPPPPDAPPLSLHDALPISSRSRPRSCSPPARWTRRASASSPSSTRAAPPSGCRATSPSAGCTRPTSPTTKPSRSEEHTSELQSRFDLVCRLLLEKKKQQKE